MSQSCSQEVVLSGSSEDDSMHLWDLRTATTLVSYRPAAPASSSSVACIGSDFVAVAQTTKPAMNVFNWRKDQPHARMSLPERVVSMAVTNDAAFLLAGGDSGRVLLWELSSGALLRTWEAHYRSITAIQFTDDDSHVITASEDSLVRVWSCGELLDYSASSHAAPSPVVSWNQHTLPVSALAVGAGGVAARVCSASLDRSVRVWHIPSGSCLASVSFPSPLTALALHPCEFSLFAAGSDGVVYVVDLASPVPSASGGYTLSPPQAFKGHAGAVLSLSPSLDGSLLVSGSKDGSAKVWDCASGQALKSFSGHGVAPVSFVKAMLRPPQLLDGPHVKCTTPLAQLARRHEADTAGAPGFAGPSRGLPIMIQGMCSASEVLHESGLGGRQTRPRKRQGGAQGGGGGGEGGGEDGQQWKKIAADMHALLVDQVLPATDPRAVG